jgi:fused signal recognition particle receptor
VLLKKLTFGDRLKKLLGVGIDQAGMYDELEEALIEGDMGPRIAIEIIEELRERVKQEHAKTKEDFLRIVRQILASIIKAERINPIKPGLNLFLILGVNGVGKTTTVAKLCEYYRNHGISKIMLSAGDTFRAAAIDQLKIHGERLNVRVVHHEPGADPGAVIFDTITSAHANDIELVLADTAGRLHNKENLVKELVKIDKIAQSKIQGGSYRKLLVLDATTGQNAYKQAETFKEAVHVDSIVLSKFDSTAKGGIVIQISKNLGIPFSFMGTGEKLTDLVEFDTEMFLDSLLDSGS